jgi:hypothetical protein
VNIKVGELYIILESWYSTSTKPEIGLCLEGPNEFGQYRFYFSKYKKAYFIFADEVTQELK